jgi:N-glycosyltransferase
MSFVPQPLLLESADLIVTHGGFGSVVEAIRTGTPIVLLPMFSDQPHNEARTARLTSASNSTSSPSRRRPSPRPAHGAGRPYRHRAAAMSGSLVPAPASTSLPTTWRHWFDAVVTRAAGTLAR